MHFIIYAFVAVDIILLAAAFYFVMSLDKIHDEHDDEKEKRLWR